MNANISSGSISLLSLNPLNVDPELAPVALNQLPNLLALEVTAHNLNLIILPDWHAPHVVLGPQLLREGGRHESPSYVRRGRKMPFTALRPVRGNIFVKFHLLL